MRRATRYFLFLAFAASAALAAGRLAPDPAAEMAAEASSLLGSLSSEQRARISIPFDDPERLNWHFIPRARAGLSVKQLSDDQRRRADSLLRSGLSDSGFTRVQNIRSLDQVLFDESRNPVRDPDLYFYSLFGQPGAAAWGWRLEGHHISLNFTLRDSRVVSAFPLFMGANPAQVRAGPRAGLRTLAEEEDLGRRLFLSLEEPQRARALIASAAPDEIVTGNSRRAAIGPPVGVAWTELDSRCSALLWQLVELYARRLRPELAEAELARIRRAGIEKIHFAWAGGPDPGQPHYYRVQGPIFLIEYDNTQNNANHIHTVWRDLEHDFGLDPLAAHYASSPHHQRRRLRCCKAGG